MLFILRINFFYGTTISIFVGVLLNKKGLCDAT